ncbi:MAG: type II toxin-antitoxin system RelE/ParE family toxin [Kiritimatiellae bacterium]|nr:type II toxin-antitoxin system RelE/ParE family toxin [Kiritimatiellia bacterium]
MKIRYSPAVRDDLRQLKRYLTLEFGATVASKSIAKIVSDISSLKSQRHLARPLADKVDRATDYLYFLAGRYSVVILSKGKGLYSIIRILDGRTDYVKTIFGE